MFWLKTIYLTMPSTLASWDTVHESGCRLQFPRSHISVYIIICHVTHTRITKAQYICARTIVHGLLPLYVYELNMCNIHEIMQQREEREDHRLWSFTLSYLNFASRLASDPRSTDPYIYGSYVIFMYTNISS